MAKTVKINENFMCLHCGHKVEKAQKTCRNHCNVCLYSLHVDGDVPGDRESSCHGLMEPVEIHQSGKGYIITHKCTKCRHIRKNKVLEDDVWDKVIEIFQLSTF